MPASPLGDSDLGEDEEWEIISCREWHILFNAISWSYHGSGDGPLTTPRLKAAPPRYHHALSRVVYKRWKGTASEGQECASEDELQEGNAGNPIHLNPDLVGVTLVEDVLRPYEANAGFHFSPYIFEGPQPSNNTLAVNRLTTDVSLKQHWNELVADLIGKPESLLLEAAGDLAAEEARVSPTLPKPSMDVKDPELASASYTFSVIPMSGTLSSPSDNVGSPANGTAQLKSSSKRLNASASSFVPSSSSSSKLMSPPVSRSPSPLFTDFTFPSLNSSVQSLPPSLQKDENGFYTEIGVSTPCPGSASSLRRRPSQSTPLSFFLSSTSSPRPSKTRAIVDRLRSASISETRKGTLRTATSSYDALDSVFYIRRAASEDHPGSPPSGVDTHSSLSTPSAAGAEETDIGGWIHAKPCSGDKTHRTRSLIQALDGRSRAASLDSKTHQNTGPGYIHEVKGVESSGVTDEGRIEVSPEQDRSHVPNPSSTSSHDSFSGNVSPPSVSTVGSLYPDSRVDFPSFVPQPPRVAVQSPLSHPFYNVTYVPYPGTQRNIYPVSFPVYPMSTVYTQCLR